MTGTSMMLMWHSVRSSRRVIAFAGSSAAVSRSNQCVALQILVQIAAARHRSADVYLALEAPSATLRHCWSTRIPARLVAYPIT